MATRCPIRAYVKLLSDGHYVNDGPMMDGLTVDLGPTALAALRTTGRTIRATR